MKYIYIFTTGFPYGVAEPFLGAELPFFSNAIVVSTYIGDIENIPCILPQSSNMMVLHPSTPFFKGKKVARILAAVKAIASPLFWKELHSKDIYPLRIKKIKQLLSCISKATELTAFMDEEIAKRIKPEDSVVFYAYWMNQLALATVILAKKYGGKAVARCHGYDLYKRNENNQYVTFQTYLTNELDGIYPISQNGKDTLLNLLKDGKDAFDKIVVSRLGTYDYGLCPSERSSTFTIVSCSNVVALKRVGMIIEAIEKIDSFQIHWIHFGDGVLLPKLKEKIKEDRSQHFLEMRGQTPNNDIIRFYKNNHIDMFINVSESEGIPVSIMEALSFGIPCLATDVGGVHEIIKNGVNGLLIEGECTVNTITKKIIEIREILLSEAGNDLRQRARLSWEANYSAEKNYPLFARLLEGE